ncbi:CFC_collapsed_G0057480.mRNA.1.CDS.1 [Saccharomyces cerevisiae]|nr:CFC_collapsed_G0057480.mRNA.1.CDS.1 [Saccharomyces cerevisiae]
MVANDDDEDNVDPLHRAKQSSNKTVFSSSSSNISSKDVSPDPIFSPDPADDSSNTSDDGSRVHHNLRYQLLGCNHESHP